MKTNLEVLRIYADKVLDLSRRNRLLKFPKGARSVTFLMNLEEFQNRFGIPEELNIEFGHREILKEEEKEEVIQDKLLLASKEDLKETLEEESELIPPTTPKGKKLITSLTSLRLDTKRKFEEHGLHTLFITVGKIKWNEMRSGKSRNENKQINKDDFDYIAPILLIPVLISEKKNPKKTTINTYLENNDISFNIALNLLLEKEYNTRTVNIDETLITNLPQLFNNLTQQIEEIFEELKVKCEITPEIQMGQYTFYGQQIYEDLVKHEHEILENNFINALCTHTAINQANLAIDGDSNEFFRPETDFNVLEADTSQVQVIQSALKGNHLNIQGPPGTGKSQTIVNIISNFLARNRSVLLVCEKNVALEVVLKRLREKGLDKLCLPLFQYNEDKKVFAKKIIEDRDSIMRSNYDDVELNNILIAREKKIQLLKNYATALGNIVEPLHKNVYWVHGELAKHQQLTKLEPLISHAVWQDNNPLEISFDKYREIMTILENMSSIFNLGLDEKHIHWEKLNRSVYSKDLENNILRVLSKIQKLSDGLETEFENFSLESIQQIRQYADCLDSVKNITLSDNNINKKSDILTIETKLRPSLLSAKKYIETQARLNKNYKIPLKWDDESYMENKDLILNQEAELSFLDELLRDVNKISALVENVRQNLKQLNEVDFLEIESLAEILLHKEVISSYSQTLHLRKRSKLEDLNFSLEQLGTLNSLDIQLRQIKTIFNRWGIIPSSLIKEHKLHAKKFLDEYSNPLKRLPFVFPGYKNDKRIIEEWAIARIPNKFEEYKEITIAVRDWYIFQARLDLLKKNFIDEQLGKGKTLTSEQIEPLFEAVRIVCEFLQSQGKEEVPQEIINLIEKNRNKTDLIFETLSEFPEIYKLWHEIRGSFKVQDAEKENLDNLESIVYVGKKQIENILSTFKNTTSLLQSTAPINILELQADLEEIRKLREHIEEIEKNNFGEIYLVKNYIEAIINDFDKISSFNKNLILANQILRQMNLQNVQSNFSLDIVIKTIKELKEELPSLIEWFNEYQVLKIELDELFNCTDSISNLETLPIKEFQRRIANMIKDTDGLERWTTYKKYSQQIEKTK